MNEEQIKAILSVSSANKLEKVSYEYLEELSINQATKIYVLQQENQQLKEVFNELRIEIMRVYPSIKLLQILDKVKE